MALKVLIVDDDVPTLEFIVEVLTSLGLEAQPVSDSLEAATLIHQEKFDGIFLDLMMPVIDGIELTRQIRQSSRNKRSPIVIVTARDDKQAMAETFKAGAMFFLHKPVNKARLTGLLNSTYGTMLKERRRFPRIPLRTGVACQVASRSIWGVSYNLGHTGIIFQGDGFLKPGQKVRLTFSLPDQKPAMEVEGIVARVDARQRVGVYFTQIATKDHQHIKDFVASQTV